MLVKISNSLSLHLNFFIIFFLTSKLLHLMNGFVFNSLLIVVGREGKPDASIFSIDLNSSFRIALSGSTSCANFKLERVYSCPQ